MLKLSFAAALAALVSVSANAAPTQHYNHHMRRVTALMTERTAPVRPAVNEQRPPVDAETTSANGS